MNKTPLVPGPLGPTPDPSPHEFVFEWMDAQEGTELDEDGVREVIEVQCSASARIIEPEPGKVIESPVFLWCWEHQKTFYAILGIEADHHAVRTEAVSLPNVGQSFRMRTVVLDEPGRPLAWEVLRQDSEGAWRPLKGQHLRPRTALAEQWLAEINPVLTRLTVHERKLMAHRQALGQGPLPGQLREPSIPTPPSLAPPAQHPGPDPRDLRSLADHPPRPQPDPMRSLSLPAPVQDPARQWVLPSVPPLALKLYQELIELADQFREAHELIGYLRQQQGRQVTLLQTSIEERRAQIPPTMPHELWLALRRTPGYRMRT